MEQNLENDQLIELWAADKLEQYGTEINADQLLRTAIITIARVREARHFAALAHQINEQYNPIRGE